ncbi:hypothetical protein ACQ4PT_064530 [Festuca glaucescens]
MYPTNQYMDPCYSYCRDHPPYQYYPPPGWESGHPQMAMDSSCRPPSYGPLPYSGSTSHSHLPESHSCCNKIYPPGYYSFRPPFPQELPPPQLYYHGPFPHHLSTYPSYFVPPPPYSIDQIPYGYDKLKGHCCGCPNHVCHGGERSNLKIEEEMPEVKPDSGHKGADNSSIIGHPSYLYPAMRLPSGNVKDAVKGRGFEMPPHRFSKWFPESGERAADEKQESHDNHNARQFQWPVIWMPRGYDEPKQETKEFKEVDQNPKVTKEAPHSQDVKIIPLSWFEDGHNDQKPVSRDGSGEHNGRSSAANQSAGAEHRHDAAVGRNCKTIPVVPGELKNENKPAEKNCKAVSIFPDKEGDEKKVRTCRTIPVMVQKNNDEKASNVEKEGEHRKNNHVETSKAKPSKLPPVCLRVDPLPRKKSGNKSSGSLNPATKKVCQKENDTKEAQSKNQEKKLSEANKESNVPVKEKPSEMDKRIVTRHVTVQDTSVKSVQEEDISAKVDQKVQPSIRVQPQEKASDGSLQECTKSTKVDEMKFQGEASKSAREINLSESDAAVRIQSAYRGYDVRRWQPLEKLRKVRKVHDQMQDLKKQLQGIEAFSKQLTVKEQVAINETIMNLLLNLDSIQGLHPSVREARKPVARELVCLQEKLDSLCKQLPSEPNHFRCEKEEPEITDTANASQTTARVSTAEGPEEGNAAANSEGHEVSSVVCVESLHDESLSEESSTLERCVASTEPNSCTEELNTGVSSPGVDKDGAAEGQVWQSAASESSVLKPTAAAATEDDQYNGTSVQFAQPCVYLKDAELDEHDPRLASIAFCLGDQPEEARDADMQNQVADAMQDSDREPDGTTEPMVSDTNSMEYVSTDIAENSLQSPLLEQTPQSDSGLQQSRLQEVEVVKQHDPTLVDLPNEARLENPEGGSSSGEKDEAVSSENKAKTVENTLHVAGAPSNMCAEPDLPESVSNESPCDQDSTRSHENSAQSPLLEEMPQPDSAPQQSQLKESEVVKQCEVSYKDDLALVNQTNETRLENPARGSSVGEKHEAASLENEAKTMEKTMHVARVPTNMCAEPGLSESMSKEPLCDQDGDMLHENPDSKTSLERQSHPQNEDLSRDKTSECNETLQEASVCVTGPHCAELPADNSKEDAGIQTASEEVATVSAAHGAVTSDEKNLADENLKLKEMLQKLLSSGNDQMGIITELSEKVRALEGKLARKRRPKLRVRRPARNATDNLH